MTINETVLEMHFHKPLLDLIRDTFGLGPGGQMNFYKYSPQRECFVGFDQAYARTQLSTLEFFNMLRSSAMTSNYTVAGADRFLGYFLQYKVGHEMTRRMNTTPNSITAKPYIRFKLDTKKNDKTGFSQHELLYRLNRNRGALVYYACPMLFVRDDLYEVDVDFDKLRLVTLDDCPGPFQDNASHHLFFNDAQANPVWASEPHEGTAIAADYFAGALHDALQAVDPAESGPALLDLLTNVDALEPTREAVFGEPRPQEKLLNMVSEPLTIVRVSEKGQQPVLATLPIRQ